MLPLRVPSALEPTHARWNSKNPVRSKIMKTRIFQIDAFTQRRFAGNPAAVMPLESFLPDATLQASSGDVPLMLYTGPQLDQSAFGTSLGNMGDDAVVVEAYVDANGRVEDYRILSQPADAKAVLPELKNLLIFTTFHPALSMGRPTAGTAVLSFSKISVRG